MRAYVNDQNCEGIDPPVTHARVQRGDTVYVHLCSGQIVEVKPATAVRIAGEALEVLNGEDLVASFPKARVYFASDEEMEPPSLT